MRLLPRRITPGDPRYDIFRAHARRRLEERQARRARRRLWAARVAGAAAVAAAGGGLTFVLWTIFR